MLNYEFPEHIERLNAIHEELINDAVQNVLQKTFKKFDIDPKSYFKRFEEEIGQVRYWMRLKNSNF